MKKSIYLLFALFMLSMLSCNYAMDTKGNTMTEDPMAKENKSYFFYRLVLFLF